MSKKKLSLDEKKEEIEDLGLGAIKNYFGVVPKDMDKNTLQHLHQKARIGMQFEKEMSLSKRAVEMNYLRVFKMISEDKKELKKYIRKTMPKNLPT